MISKEDLKMYKKMTKKQLIEEIKRFDDFIDFMCDRQVGYKLYPPYYIMENGLITSPNTYPLPKWPVTDFPKDGTIS